MLKNFEAPQLPKSLSFEQLLDAKVEWKILIIIRIALGAECSPSAECCKVLQSADNKKDYLLKIVSLFF